MATSFRGPTGPRSISDGVSDYDPGVELPKIISVDDHVVEPRAPLARRWLPARFRDRGPAGRAARHRRRCEHIGGGAYEQTFDDDGPEGRLLGLRGPRLHQQAPRRRGRLRPRRHDDVADHLRRDAARAATSPKARVDDMDDELGRGVALLPDVPALLRPDVPRGEGPRARARRASYAYNDWMVEEWCGDSGGRLIPLSIDPAVGRRSSRPPRCGATRRAACARCASARSRRTSGCRRIHSGDWDPFFAACQETEHRRVHAHRLVVADAGDVGRRAGRGGGDAELQQRDGVALRLPVLRRARALPRR